MMFVWLFEWGESIFGLFGWTRLGWGEQIFCFVDWIMMAILIMTCGTHLSLFILL